MGLTKTVITISRNEPLQMTRTALLRHAGYSVVALTSDAEVMKYIASEGRPAINLILLCHSVPERSRVSLCKALKSGIPKCSHFDALQRLRSDTSRGRWQAGKPAFAGSHARYYSALDFKTGRR
jgi:CheY-like chemotaxis protein